MINYLLNIDFKENIDIVELANSNNFELTPEEEDCVSNVS